MSPILGFSGKYRFLSNFYPVEFTMFGHTYPSSEHAYMSFKTADEELRRKIRLAVDPARAKVLGRSIKLRDNWDSLYRDKAMLWTLMHKFDLPELRDALNCTGDVYIEETNHWGDIYWGVCNGIGQNKLGRMLMWVRDNPYKLQKILDRGDEL